MTATHVGASTGASDAASSRPIVNTHVHLPPNFSSFETVADAVAHAAAEAVAALGASNFYDLRVYRAFAEAAREAGIHALFGIEIIAVLGDLQSAGTLVNDPDNPGRIYLCGKGIARFEQPTPGAEVLMARIREGSDRRIREIADRSAERFAAAGLRTSCSEETITADTAARSGVPPAWVALQERHVARALQEELFRQVPPDGRGSVLAAAFGVPSGASPTDAVAVQNEIRSRLMKAGGPAFVPEAAVSFADAYELVLELGGIPCYPTLADGASPICGFEDPPEALADRLLARGVHCAELIPARNRREAVDTYVGAFRRAGILVMAGTEHNTQRRIPIEPACLGGEESSESARDAFWEGACVVAAHQWLVASGQPGYVDGRGRLNPAFDDGEARIRAFREIGAGLIRAGAPVRSRS